MSIIANNRTIAELRAAHSTEGSFRSALKQDKHDRYKKSGKPIECIICKKTTELNFSYIVRPSEFDDDTPISQLNDPENIEVMCKMHYYNR